MQRQHALTPVSALVRRWRDLRRDGLPEGRRGLAELTLVAVLAVGLGALTSASPLGLLAAVGLAGLAAILVMGRRSISLFHAASAGLLIGYAFLGRGLAHVGVPPLYLGEIVLALGLIAFLFRLPVRLRPTHVLLVLFMFWGLLGTVPYLATYGLDALRDGVAWGYAVFALVLSVTVAARHVERVVAWYRRVLPIFIVWVPFAAVVSSIMGFSDSDAPGSVPLLVFKGGDMGVHLAGVGSFILVGLYTTRRSNPLSEAALWVGWLVALVTAGAINRGGMVAALIATSVAAFMGSAGRWLSLFLAALILAAAAGLFNPTINIGRNRAISPGQFIENAISLFTTSGETGLQGTKEFRLAWWQAIVSYTIDGPYFWTGKGYGINLADADGFQVTADHSLRSPHNSHLEMLARGGVPGLALWVVVEIAFAWLVLRGFLAARAAGMTFWAAVLVWLFAYWLAASVNMSFDPYLQGPQGGIWFWSIYGLGLAAVRCVSEASRPAEGDVSEARRGVSGNVLARVDTEHAGLMT
jgi:hypothetical protein